VHDVCTPVVHAWYLVQYLLHNSFRLFFARCRPIESGLHLAVFMFSCVSLNTSTAV